MGTLWRPATRLLGAGNGRTHSRSFGAFSSRTAVGVPHGYQGPVSASCRSRSFAATVGLTMIAFAVIVDVAGLAHTIR